MNSEKRYNQFFVVFIVSVILVFFYLRPLNSPWHKFIAGDGLGYYSYLPARFIHNDKNYDFKWFNRVYNANYIYSAFENPEQNILVEYEGRKINKFYQGLSYIWFPFFLAAHVFVKIFHYPPDGFSQPYQLAVGLASLVYLIIGLIFLRKLILKLFDNQFAAFLVPVSIFYGTHLFTYSIKGNCLSHAYSFTFLTLFIYYLHSFFNDEDKKLQNILLCLLFFVITGCIRPLNGLAILIVPAFVPAGFFKEKFKWEKLKANHLIILALVIGAVFNQLAITYLQTGSVFSYTYSGEKFYFNRSRFFDALFSYYLGLFVYVPVTFVSMCGLSYLPMRKRVFLLFFFLLVVFLYSSWWYWPILKRALIDVYVVPAIFLGALAAVCRTIKQKAVFSFVMLLSIAYYQLKNMQMSGGILDEYTTHKELFWRNFFRLDKANIYPIPPSIITKQSSITEDFENAVLKLNVTDEKKYSGNKSVLLDSKNFITNVAECNYPEIFKAKENKKIRFSFYCYADKGVNSIHAFLQFFDKQHKALLEIPFYMNSEFIFPEKWDYKEFGYELAPEDVKNADKVDKIMFTVWNVEAKKKLYVDDVKVEFILTDRSMEITK